MSSPLYFDPVLPLYWLLPAALLLMILFGWQESRKLYRFKALRVFTQVLAILSLLAMLMRPSWDVTESSKGLIVLTENYSQRALDSLLRLQPKLRVVRAPGLPSPFRRGVGGKVGSDSVTSYRDLEQVGHVRFVLGDGIPVAYMEVLQGGFQFIPGRPPTGVVELNTTPYPEHRRNWLTGKVRGSKGTRLVLAGLGGVEDSTTVRTNSLAPFQLAFTTKVDGQYVYTLTITDSTGVKTVEDVPVEVVASRKLSVLLLQAYPTAEIRFLKNYLTAKGHRLVTRYQVSKNTFRYEVANGAAAPSGALEAGKLHPFDLLIADTESLDRLSAQERLGLEEGVRGGLGLLVLLQGLPDARRFPDDELRLTPIAGAPDTVRYSLGSFGSFTGPYVAVQAGPRVQAIRVTGNTLLQGLVLVGGGKVAVQTLRETYRLALGGDNSAYAALWTPLLESAARREDVPLKLRVTTSFPVYPDEPVDFELIGPGPVKATTGSTVIPLAEDVVIDDLWRGRTWMGEAGWSGITAGDSLRHHFFVSQEGAWKSLRTQGQRQANLMAEGVVLQDTPERKREEIPPLVFFLIFLVGMGVVWVAPKL